MSRWTAADVPDLTGRTVLVTGATSGLGRATAEILAARGARVLATGRDVSRLPAGVEPVELDLADQASVRAAAAAIRDPIDVLVNNAGVMGTPPTYTVDGFELQIATNHLGPAALTWLLLPQVTRVVTVSSLAHRGGGLDPDDLHFRRRPYRASVAYAQSKLANLLFTAELARHGVFAVAAHPGLADTALHANSLRRRGLGGLARPVNAVLCQRVERGVLPQLYAAVGPVAPGDYVGPRGLGETRGYPGPARRSAAAQDPALARRLWDATVAETGVTPDLRPEVGEDTEA
ncbi:SDR family NAD(P)-dependent oxidoreductase [Pseudonocardia oroxyli]|uniref:Protochlorophyllide reductase n=1 Tax=Pseudonocardia oroxyli TaxID=366584 RepID=A0A1G7ZZ09_PSEOR|nr:SDR family NAD(P)-dependent oxidoreductase [Pseudonocardia oroxyli]SDH13914.1 protochlorophyllide reductase [Pseudonocardia oroxyli]